MSFAGRRRARLGNALRRWRAGLPLRDAGARVSPEAPTDLFQAHLAAYCFAGRLVSGRAAGAERDAGSGPRVLDLGCGTGYGSAYLLGAGAAAVVGLDPDRTAIDYARRRFGQERIEFILGRAEEMAANEMLDRRPEGRVLSRRDPSRPGPLGGRSDGALEGRVDLGFDSGFDWIVAANLLAHLDAPTAVLAAARRVLAPAGALIASVPPIVDEHTMELHRAAATHRANRYLWDWEALLRDHFEELSLFRLLPPAGASLDLSDPRPSRHAATAFRCDEIPLAEPDAAGTLAAIFVCTRPRRDLQA